MSRSSALALPALAAVAAVVLTIILFSGSDDSYHLRLSLDNAAGLREGSGVRVAGLPVGKIEKLVVDQDDRVVADLSIDPDHAPISRGVRVAITPVNLLGQKVIALEDSDPAADAAPSGYTVPAKQVTVASDLDQVLGTLDPDTRTRLAVLLNEAGLAVSNRRLGLQTILREYPTSADLAAQLVQRLKSDNATLGKLVDHSSRFVTRLARQREDLGDLIDSAGRTSAVLAERRRELQATLASAPRNLAALRGFLGDLRRTARPLGEAAGDLSRASAPLTQVLQQLEPFTKDARPALERAVETAPALSKLADGATPVIKQLRPTAHSLQSFSEAMAPASKVLDKSSDNLIAILENWSHAIGLRDQLSHMFRVEIAVDPETGRQLIDRLVAATAPKAKRKVAPSSAARTPASTSDRAPTPAAATAPKKLPTLPQVPVVTQTLDKLVDAVGGLVRPKAGAPASTTDPKPAHDVSHILDYLLGP